VTLTGGNPWWNEWWYDDPFLQPGGKWVKISFDWRALLNQVGSFHVTINYSDSNYKLEGAPPPEANIVRITPWTIYYGMNPDGTLAPSNGSFDSGKYYLPIDYNPVWVSVDVRPDILNPNDTWWIANGVIQHQCVPLPAALWLLGPGLVGLGFLRRKFKG
jgi:hypothetical protein